MAAPDPVPVPAASCCPTCGAELRDQFSWDEAAGIFIANGVAVRFTATRAKVVDALWRHRNRGAIPDLVRFMELVYADHRDGGPDTPNSIAVYLIGIRAALHPTGYTVTLNQGSPKRGYKLVKIEGPK